MRTEEVAVMANHEAEEGERPIPATTEEDRHLGRCDFTHPIDHRVDQPLRSVAIGGLKREGERPIFPLSPSRSEVSRRKAHEKRYADG
ncbi:hypothetical protein GW17_00039453 [Ensete ventricosum]|nr:hypothetical protein GW17_00039453 [Ensete ventricosum]